MGSIVVFPKMKMFRQSAVGTLEVDFAKSLPLIAVSPRVQQTLTAQIVSFATIILIGCQLQWIATIRRQFQEYGPRATPYEHGPPANAIAQYPPICPRPNFSSGCT